MRIQQHTLPLRGTVNMLMINIYAEADHLIPFYGFMAKIVLFKLPPSLQQKCSSRIVLLLLGGIA